MRDRPLKGNEVSLLVGFLETTPLGYILVAVSKQGVRAVRFCQRDEFESHLADQNQSLHNASSGLLSDTLQQINEYFQGKGIKFELPIDWSGLNPFSAKVLMTTHQIEFGKLRFYSEIAQAIQSPKASRAVGGALGRNPIALIIPCHRVVAKHGGLCGFSAPGGLSTKAWLLRHEGHQVVSDKNVVL